MMVARVTLWGWHRANRRTHMETQRRPNCIVTSGVPSGLGPCMVQVHLGADAARHHNMPLSLDDALGGLGR